ncbi:hypothetical protein Lgra_1863 [Legionella gratiana]|uniref:Uncharacterized protein n=1 Tax=Legionella gratiana TaxID=45066 RepID=A0A378JFV5_9GAMM|nr:hypothetical protein Lgra_1863 [Legionella gratiana]STX45871.1 Uncharacterised protein [Legionella gratiana]
MIIKKIVLLGVISVATFLSTSAFADHHFHRHHPRFKFFPHHHRHHQKSWRNIHRWTPPGNYIVVPNRTPYSYYHHHY